MSLTLKGLWAKVPASVQVLVVKAFHTFWQAYVGLVLASGGASLTSKHSQIAALAAAASMAKNTVVSVLKKDVSADASADVSVSADVAGTTQL